MKIEKIILKNFAAIDNAMKCKEFSIDFSKAMNKVCLLIGPNGSGKTTILSLLHPFAGIGNLDVRDSLNLILDGENGYKEITISNGDDVYLIKHFYTPHKDKNHSVKSYISKNGNELNENGNVTSFKEYVRMELGVEPDHLKLTNQAPDKLINKCLRLFLFGDHFNLQSHVYCGNIQGLCFYCSHLTVTYYNKIISFACLIYFIR